MPHQWRTVEPKLSKVVAEARLAKSLAVAGLAKSLAVAGLAKSLAVAGLVQLSAGPPLAPQRQATQQLQEDPVVAQQEATSSVAQLGPHNRAHARRMMAPVARW